VRLQLYSILREKLPPEAKGQSTLDLEDGATIADIIEMLDIRRNIVISVNDVHEPDISRALRDGDSVRMFSSVGGG